MTTAHHRRHLEERARLYHHGEPRVTYLMTRIWPLGMSLLFLIGIWAAPQSKLPWLEPEIRAIWWGTAAAFGLAWGLWPRTYRTIAIGTGMLTSACVMRGLSIATFDFGVLPTVFSMLIWALFTVATLAAGIISMGWAVRHHDP